FILETHERPKIDRLEGGHIKISPKVEVEDRTKLTPTQAIELVRLTMLAGEAMIVGLAKQGIEIGRINYQDNGNWNPTLHVHLYGRAKTATIQKYGDPITPGHQPEFKPLNDDDILAIQTAIESFEKQPKYLLESWGL
ncbi:MAG: hypothetical protein LBG64_01195, partial [Pseudomonadales bacterium]|nr:hypothetical protein [Pseudomonadales bacterium]